MSSAGQGPPSADQIPAVPSDLATHYAHVFAGICITLVVMATIIFSARVWTRCYPIFRMAADDYVCAFAYAFVLIDSALYLRTVSWVFTGTRETLTLADIEDAFFYAIIGQPFWAWSMAAIKCSVALMLLRLEQNATWRRFLWAMIILQVALAMYNMLTQLLQCVPLKKAWDLLGIVEGKCWSTGAVRASSIAVQVFHILTDWIFALLPISFLRKVQRPLRERIIIGILMALGIFAGVASVVKIVALANFGKSDDPTAESIQIGMWSCIEELVAFVAACVPCLRAPFQRVLEHFGLASSHHPSTYGRAYGQMYGGSGPQKHTRGKRSQTAIGSGIRMNSLKGADAHSEEHILTRTGEDVKGGEIWCTTEVRLEEEEEDGNQTGKTGRGEGGPNASWSDESATMKDIRRH